LAGRQDDISKGFGDSAKYLSGLSSAAKSSQLSWLGQPATNQGVKSGGAITAQIGSPFQAMEAGGDVIRGVDQYRKGDRAVGGARYCMANPGQSD